MSKEVKGIDRDVRTKIKEDIKWTKAQKKECCEDYIQYDCY